MLIYMYASEWVLDPLILGIPLATDDIVLVLDVHDIVYRLIVCEKELNRGKAAPQLSSGPLTLLGTRLEAIHKSVSNHKPQHKIAL